MDVMVEDRMAATADYMPGVERDTDSSRVPVTVLPNISNSREPSWVPLEGSSKQYSCTTMIGVDPEMGYEPHTVLVNTT